MAINLISKIKPKNNGAFPVYEDVDVQGGFQTRDTITDRNAIPSGNRKIGMLVYVRANSTYYTLLGGIADINWVVANLGGGGNATLPIILSDGYGDGYVIGVLPVLKGGGTAKEMHFNLLSGSTSINDNTFTVVGAIRFDKSILATAGDGSRSIKLEVILETSSVTAPQANARLYNYDTVGVVSGSTLNTTNATPTFLTTSDLSSSTNMSSGAAIYQIQISMNSGGGPSDRITCSMARLVVRWF